jgi:hypothetical protein
MNPSAQISHFEVYSSPFSIYNDMYNGVPTHVVTIEFPLVFLAKPKSPSLRVLPLLMILAGFKSLTNTNNTYE